MGEPISREGVSVGVGRKGRESVAKGGCRNSFRRECMLKGGGHRQVQRGKRSGCDRCIIRGREMIV